MIVVKKNGKLEEFDLEKVKSSIDSAATDIGITLNESDLKILSKDIIKRLIAIRGFNGEYSSYEIIGVVIEVLKKRKFGMILGSYLKYKVH